MRLQDSIKIALFSLKTNKSRSFLAILGIVIGISAVITMISLGEITQKIVLSQIETMGHNLAFILPGGTKQENGIPQFSAGMIQIKTLKVSDAKALKKESPYIKDAIPLVFGPAVLEYREKRRSVDFIGASSNYQKVRSNKILDGRFFTEREDKGMEKVVVIGKKVKEKLFKNENPVGKKMKINKKSFRIIGVVEVEGMRDPTFDPNDRVFIPLNLAQKQMLGINHLNAVLLQSNSAQSLDLAVSDAKRILRERHGIKDTSEDDFTIMSQEYIASSFNLIGNILTLFLSAIAAISLVVGGIGIMNVMLVSVTERVREIGLKKAVGARKKDILWQFLLESISLTLLGGFLGILIGVFGSFLGSLIIAKLLKLNWQFVLSPLSVILGFSISTLTGLVFGIYPAHKAAQLSPIEALRYE